MNEHFIFNSRLGIHVPNLQVDWSHYDELTQSKILFDWEKIRGSIPDRIAELEQSINEKQAQLSNETNFQRSCELNSEIAELASIINDLWLWYRANQTVTAKVHQ